MMELIRELMFVRNEEGEYDISLHGLRFLLEDFYLLADKINQRQLTIAFLLFDRKMFLNLISKEEYFSYNLNFGNIQKHLKKVAGEIFDLILKEKSNVLNNILEKDFEDVLIGNQSSKKTVIIHNELFLECSFVIKAIEKWFEEKGLEVEILTKTYTDFCKDFKIKPESLQQRSIEASISIYNLVGKIEIESSNIYDFNKILEIKEWPSHLIVNFIDAMLNIDIGLDLYLHLEEGKIFLLSLQSYFSNNFQKNNQQKIELILNLFEKDYRIKGYFEMSSFETILVETSMVSERIDDKLYGKNIIFLPSKRE